MVIILKTLRAIVLIMGWWQVIAILPIVTWIGNEVTTEMMVGLILKGFFIIVFFGASFGFKKIIQKLQGKRTKDVVIESA